MHAKRRKILEFLYRTGNRVGSDKVEVVEALQATGLKLIDPPLSPELAHESYGDQCESTLAQASLMEALEDAGFCPSRYMDLLPPIDDRLDIFGIEFIPPPLISPLGISGVKRFRDFFLVRIRNRNTRRAYAASIRSFLDWCQACGIETLTNVRTEHVGRYFEEVKNKNSISIAGQRLSAIRHMFDWMIAGQNVKENPVASKRSLLSHLYH